MTTAARAQSGDSALEQARKMLRCTQSIDGHNDLPWEIRDSKTAPRDVAAYDIRQTAPKQTDLPRMAEGEVGAQFWSIYIPTGWRSPSPPTTSSETSKRAKLPRCSGWRVGMPSKIRLAPSAPITHSAP